MNSDNGERYLSTALYEFEVKSPNAPSPLLKGFCLLTLYQKRKQNCFPFHY